jgi:DNA-binding NarL/FixJ family response regulator
MPEMSGLELCRAARVLLPSLPLLIVTGYIDNALRSGATALGVELVAKEDAFEALVPAVASVLRPSTLPREASRCLRVSVLPGSIPYSAVTHPLPEPRRQPGTCSSTMAVQMTRVFPAAISTLPVALVMNPGSM